LVWKGLTVKRCPSCSSEEFKPAGRRMDGSSVSVCSRCGLGFLNPMPTGREIEEMYSNYFKRNDSIGYNDYPTWPHTTSLDYLLADLIKRYERSKPRSLLDVGCAYGARVAFFKKLGFRATGVDISEEATSHGRKKWNLDLKAVRFEEFAPKETYDVVTMIDFVEHISEPLLWTEKLDALTHKDSLLLILTPDFDCRSVYGDKWIGYNASLEHVLFHNRRSLSCIFGQIGFGILFASNVKSMPPTVDQAETKPKLRSSILEHLRKLKAIEAAKNIDTYRQSVMHKLTWRGLLSSDNLENSLLIVARKSR